MRKLFNHHSLIYFDQAIRFDYKYGLRAGADEDFIQFRDEIEQSIATYRSEIQTELRSYLAKYDQLEISFKQPILARHNLSIDHPAQSFFDELKSTLTTSPLADLTRVKNAAPACLSRLHQSLKSAKEQILGRARELRERKEPSFYVSFEEGENRYLLFGIVAYALSVLWGFSQGIVSGILMMVIVGPLIFIAVGWTGQHIVMPLFHFISNSTKKSERLSTAARFESEASEL